MPEMDLNCTRARMDLDVSLWWRRIILCKSSYALCWRHSFRLVAGKGDGSVVAERFLLAWNGLRDGLLEFHRTFRIQSTALRPIASPVEYYFPKQPNRETLQAVSQICWRTMDNATFYYFENRLLEIIVFNFIPFSESRTESQSPICNDEKIYRTSSSRKKISRKVKFLQTEDRSWDMPSNAFKSSE